MLLSELTTLEAGGAAGTFVRAESEAEIIAAVQAADAAKSALLIVGGGSNLVVADAGFDGTVLQIASTGYQTSAQDSSGGASVQVQAGHPWDDFVHESVLHAWSCLETLSGIPGSTGATPVQNVGAYGADVSQSIALIRTWDREVAAVKTFTNSELKFGYRNSMLKRSMIDGSPRYVVLTVEFRLALGRMSQPIRYAQLAATLGIEVGERAYALEVREAVLALRRSKGMVSDAADRDSFSTGSFFTNPIVAQDLAAGLPAEAPQFPVETVGLVKLSAAWLISQSGFDRGFGAELTGGRATLSTKHSLAISNRGGATTADVLAVARAVRAGVFSRFGIELEPEPVLIGCSL
ncbi:UDP-N-acetylenolpyruvoylglucosamine reductase [Renibacterium salmoninarum ATCC 33209]|uniref:UDP-N-acetylenolpyruvoylglucosamine reductase n=1 Tax=Renibacterium salmoninarum (strain ATCC 33209 / DSM 20767 / JCM 11484 / NBRC 15589 / NCIMB 2235) TaxID=288705 RepID=A9WNF8_RENSM|nr:UDP-N-acetylmuramate dehydrogenase [Renibacterium salmoninarum]ABY22685.1 UDP-N-acetylenolpyruvoylglucosamine reductase [Renibacterium salmoninarum ATCC 33209]